MVRVVYNPPPMTSTSPAPIPLTHHAILTLVAPFTRRDRHVDLAASDRAQRRLRFKPVQHADRPAPGQQLTELLTLEHPEADHFRLMRVVRDDAGLESMLEIDGDDVEQLLAQVEAVPVERQIICVEGAHIARDYRLVSVAADEQGEAQWRPQLQQARVHLQGISLTLNAKTGRKMPADFELRADQERRLKVPPDLLAVLGWEWRPMRQYGKAWRGSVRIAANEPERTADIESQLTRAVKHLARTLRSDPAEFHNRWRSARWRVTFQRAIPMLIGLGLLAAVPLIPMLSLENASPIRMLIFHGPPLLLIGIFMMRELPVIEIPPLPRRLIGRDWIVDDAKGRYASRPVQGVETG
jgi:hypothetical protein